MPSDNSGQRELNILETLEARPEATQANLAAELGVAVGTVNFVVKRLVKKGYLRVRQLERRRLRYIVTPAGMALRTQLALDSLSYSMRLYRETREAARRLIDQVRQQGSSSVAIEGDGELADVVRLTCLEMNLAVKPAAEGSDQAVIEIVGTTLRLRLQSAFEAEAGGHPMARPTATEK